MISRTHRRFWRCFETLPVAMQMLAREKFAHWRRDPFHPPLHFKALFGNVWSVRINHSYRALARRESDLIVWFWIGSHEEYNEFIKRLK